MSAKVRPLRAALSPATLADLGRSGLDDRDAVRMQITDVDPAWSRNNLNVAYAGYMVPYFDFEGRRTGFFRVRLHVPEPRIFAGQKITIECPKYLQPAGSGIALYLPPGTDWRAVLADSSRAVVVTEGEKKAVAACKAGIVTVGLGGVDSFASAKRDIDLLPELAALAAGGRRLPIVYDSDVVTKNEVLIARRKLAVRLFVAGGAPEFVELPSYPGESKTGLDDFLVRVSHE